MVIKISYYILAVISTVRNSAQLLGEAGELSPQCTSRQYVEICYYILAVITNFKLSEIPPTLLREAWELSPQCTSRQDVVFPSFKLFNRPPPPPNIGMYSPKWLHYYFTDLFQRYASHFQVLGLHEIYFYFSTRENGTHIWRPP